MSRPLVRKQRAQPARPGGMDGVSWCVLQGRKEITGFLKHSWPTVMEWIELGAPIAHIDRYWEADTRDLLEWRRNFIRQRIEESAEKKQGARKKSGPRKT